MTSRDFLIFNKLNSFYPEEISFLPVKSPFVFLVTVMLSASSTDVRASAAADRLFFSFPDEKALSEANVEEIEKIIHDVGLSWSKAKNIKLTAKKIAENGLPTTMEELVALPGVDIDMLFIIGFFQIGEFLTGVHRMDHFRNGGIPLNISVSVGADIQPVQTVATGNQAGVGYFPIFCNRIEGQVAVAVHVNRIKLRCIDLTVRASGIGRTKGTAGLPPADGVNHFEFP